MRLTRENIELIRRSWLCELPPSVKLVLLAYCLHANEQGLCWQSLARTAALTGLNARTVQRHIRTLEAAGALVPYAKPRAATQTYQLKLDALALVTLPASAQQPMLQGMEQPGLDELSFDFDLDFGDLPELPAPTPAPDLVDTLPPLPEFGSVDNLPGSVDNFQAGGGNLYKHPRQFVQTTPAPCHPNCI